MPTPNGIGVRVVNSGDSPNLPVIVGNAVEDMSPMLVPQFNTTTERDTAASVGNKLCFVGDQLQQRYGSGWRNLMPQSSYIEARRSGSSPVSMPSGDWKPVPLDTAVRQSGPDFTIDAISPKAATNGIFNIDALIAWPNGSAGRRFIGISTSSASDPDVFSRSTGYTSAGEYTSTFSTTMSLSSGDRICLYGYHDSGGALSVTTRRLFVCRVA